MARPRQPATHRGRDAPHAHDLDEILTHMDKLNELDTDNVEPMAQVLFEAEETATLREDHRAAAARQPTPPWPTLRSPAPATSKCRW